MKKIFYIIFLAFLSLIIMKDSHSQTYDKTTTVGGDWSQPEIWDPPGVPVASDAVGIIGNGITVSINGESVFCKSLSIISESTGNPDANILYFVNSSSNLTVSSDIIVGDGGKKGSIDMSNGGTITIGGNFMGYAIASFISGTGTIIYNGNSLQYALGDLDVYSTIVYYNLTVNNTSDITKGVVLRGNIQINHQLVLNGFLNTVYQTRPTPILYTLYFGQNAEPFTHQHESANKRIIGTAVMNQRSWQSTDPLQFLSVSIQGNPTQSIAYTISRTTGTYGIVSTPNYSGIACQWYIQASPDPSVLRNVTYYWLEVLDNNHNFNQYDAQVWYSEDMFLYPWYTIGDPVIVAGQNPHYIQIPTTTFFGDWTISSTNMPLPIFLESFTFYLKNRDVKLNWITEIEENNQGFEVQKSEVKSKELGNWTKIGFVKGKGNSKEAVSYSFEDKGLNTGKYKYRLKQIDYNGNFEYFELAGVVEVGVPAKFDLSQNYPNPFNPVTKINFDIPQSGLVTLKVYDMLGKEVATVVNEMKEAGYYTVNFDASGLSSGVYFYRLSSNDFSNVKRLVVLK